MRCGGFSRILGSSWVPEICSTLVAVEKCIKQGLEQSLSERIKYGLDVN